MQSEDAVKCQSGVEADGQLCSALQAVSTAWTSAVPHARSTLFSSANTGSWMKASWWKQSLASRLWPLSLTLFLCATLFSAVLEIKKGASPQSKGERCATFYRRYRSQKDAPSLYLKSLLRILTTYFSRYQFFCFIVFLPPL